MSETMGQKRPLRIFDIPRHMESVMEAISEGREPDQEQVKSLVDEGPTAIDHWCHGIADLEARSETLSKRIKEMRNSRDKADRDAFEMRRKLQEILETSFNGKVETALFTVWIQDGVIRIRPCGRKKEDL